MLKFLLLAVIPVIIAVISVAYTSRESDQVKKLTAAQAKERMDGPDPVTVVDVREPEEYDAGHIPGAVSLPVGSLSRKAAGVLPDKNTPILVYCETASAPRAPRRASPAWDTPTSPISAACAAGRMTSSPHSRKSRTSDFQTLPPRRALLCVGGPLFPSPACGERIASPVRGVALYHSSSPPL